MGAGYQRAHYTNETFNRTEVDGELTTIDFNSKLNFNKFALFASASRKFFDETLVISLGLRTDFNDYSSQMNNPLDQLSPRISASLALTDKLTLNANVGRYYQLPAYTVLGYRDNQGNLVNRDNKVTYIQSDHIVAGLELNPTRYSKISLEGFHKQYSNYPFLLNEQISLANLGSDFGVIGSEPVTSTSKGRSYGLEFLAQQKLSTMDSVGIVERIRAVEEADRTEDEVNELARNERHIQLKMAITQFVSGLSVDEKARIDALRL